MGDNKFIFFKINRIKMLTKALMKTNFIVRQRMMKDAAIKN